MDTCIGIQPEFLETPQFRALSSTEKVLPLWNAHIDCLLIKESFSGNRTCVHSVGSGLEETCAKSCEESCEKVLSSYAEDVRTEKGVKIGDKLEQTLLRRCTRQCNFECGKPGKISDFYIPSRN